jgi:hypothetical protein
MWWGGTALPGRMLISGLLLLTLPVAWEFREAADRPERRAAYRLLLLIGLATSLATVIVRNGATLALGRNGISRLLEWLSPDWHLWAFAPDFIMQPAWLALVQSGIWLLAIALSAWAVGLLAARGTATRGSSRTGRGLAFLRADAGALLAVLLVTVVMPPVLGARLKPSPSPEDRSRIEMLESFDPHARPIGIRYDPFTLADAASMPQAFAEDIRRRSSSIRSSVRATSMPPDRVKTPISWYCATESAVRSVISREWSTGKMKFDAWPVEPPGLGSGPLSSWTMSRQPRLARCQTRLLPTMPAPMTTQRAEAGRSAMRGPFDGGWLVRIAQHVA